jgi:hypothetical protein
MVARKRREDGRGIVATPQTVSLSTPTPWGILFSDVGLGDLLVYPLRERLLLGLDHESTLCHNSESFNRQHVTISTDVVRQPPEQTTPAVTPMPPPAALGMFARNVVPMFPSQGA